MKARGLITFCICINILACLSQSDTSVFNFPEKAASFPGGDSALFSFISLNTVYPKQCADSGIQGKIYISCVIEKDGSLSEVKAIKRGHPELEKEAIRVIQSLPPFQCATNAGSPVRSAVTIPVVFKVNVVQKEIVQEWQHLKVLSDVDVAPQFPGGINTLGKYLDIIFEYPLVCKQLNIQGTCQVKFTVNDKGEVVDPSILLSKHFDLDNEAIRMVNLFPDFTPATKNGKPVSCDMVLSINFVLSCSSDDFPYSSEDDYRLKYPGGFNAMIHTFLDNIYYSGDISGFGKSGKSVITFDIDTNGQIKNAQVVVSNFPELEKSMLRSLDALLKFKPATTGGVKQTGKITLPVSYKVIQNEKGTNELRFSYRFNFSRVSDTKEEYSYFDDAPELDGRPISDISRVLSKYLMLPPGEEKNADKVKVFVRCFISDDGKILAPRIYKGLSTALEKEAIRAVNQIKYVTPATRLGKPIGCEILLVVDYSNFLK